MVRWRNGICYTARQISPNATGSNPVLTAKKKCCEMFGYAKFFSYFYSMKGNNMNELTGVEKVLFKATVNFAMQHEKVTLEEAEKRAMDKVMSKRNLVKQIKFKH